MSPYYRSISHAQKTLPILTELLVQDCMRRTLTSLSIVSPLETVISSMIKYKSDTLLLRDEDGYPAGMVTQTDVMGAYYADLPLTTQAQDIMSSTAVFVNQDASLDQALQLMKEEGTTTLYIQMPGDTRLTGSLSYPDIIGVLYRHCHRCKHGLQQRLTKGGAPTSTLRFTVADALSPTLLTAHLTENITHLLEILSMSENGVLLITDHDDLPTGVVSVSDMIRAYKHGVAKQSSAETIMSSPVHLCETTDLLEQAIHTMIFTEVSNLFVYDQHMHNIVGVFSLVEATRARSGTCKACSCSRITLS